jgi:hypothetical protein
MILLFEVLHYFESLLSAKSDTLILRAVAPPIMSPTSISDKMNPGSVQIGKRMREFQRYLHLVQHNVLNFGIFVRLAAQMKVI